MQTKSYQKCFFGGFYLKREEEILTSSLLNLKQPQKTFAGIQSLACPMKRTKQAMFLSLHQPVAKNQIYLI
jgi:hypothetical protein